MTRNVCKKGESKELQVKAKLKFDSTLYKRLPAAYLNRQNGNGLFISTLSDN